MKKKIAILGSTGSIGKSTLDLIKKDKTNFEVVLLTSHRNIRELDKQVRMFNVKNLIITDNKSFISFKRKYKKKNIRIFNFGIGNKQKKVSLYTPTIYNYEFSSLSATDLTNLKISLNYFFKVLKNDFKFIKEIIKIKKLDKFNLKPDLIKIDAEGSELDILKSSIQTIKKYQPLLIIEFNQINFSEIKKILSRIGYKSYIFQNNTFSPIDKKLIKKIMKRDHLTNIVYTSKKRLLNFC